MRKVSMIKVEIVRQGKVQADVAQAAGLTESRLSRIVNGRVRPHDYELKNIHRALGVEVRKELSDGQ